MLFYTFLQLICNQNNVNYYLLLFNTSLYHVERVFDICTTIWDYTSTIVFGNILYCFEMFLKCFAITNNVLCYFLYLDHSKTSIFLESFCSQKFCSTLPSIFYSTNFLNCFVMILDCILV